MCLFIILISPFLALRYLFLVAALASLLMSLLKPDQLADD